MICACQLQNSQLVQKLLKHCESANGGLFLTAGLPIAAELGHLDIVQCLLKSASMSEHPSLSVVARNEALIFAIGKGHIGIVQYLLDHGADINAPRVIRDRQSGFNPLELAAYFGRLDIVALLLDRHVRTTGRGRVQYMRSILLATEEGHTATERLLRLRKARQWHSKDDKLWQE
ncbi:ankyrin repeat-containing domain protein, partial [Coniella lustricola]